MYIYVPSTRAAKYDRAVVLTTNPPLAVRCAPIQYQVLVVVVVISSTPSVRLRYYY